MKQNNLRELCLSGLVAAPNQHFGALRLVPLVRREPSEDLRFAMRGYDSSLGVVELDPKTQYTAYVPYGLVVDWTERGEAIVHHGAVLARTERGATTRERLRAGMPKKQRRFVEIHDRMVKREGRRRLRLLPMHIALQGFLDLHFGGPSHAWAEYSREALARGLSPRAERIAPGEDILGLDAALRSFEIHEGQCGAMVFVADALAAITIVAHPDDYRVLHHALVEDFYGELIRRHAAHHGELGRVEAATELHLDDPAHARIDELRSWLEETRRESHAIHENMASGIFTRALHGERVYELGPFTLERFVTDLSLDGENHIGECIRRKDGRVEYLKTFRLSAAQTRRAYLLRQLHAHDWHLERTATTLRTDRNGLVKRLVNAGFAYLLREHVVREATR